MVIFFNSLNARIQTKNVWDTFNKINENYKLKTVSSLEKDGRMINHLNKIAEIFVDQHWKFCRDTLNKKDTRKHNKRKKYYNQSYNESFTDIELKQQKYSTRRRHKTS